MFLKSQLIWVALEFAKYFFYSLFQLILTMSFAVNINIAYGNCPFEIW